MILQKNLTKTASCLELIKNHALTILLLLPFMKSYIRAVIKKDFFNNGHLISFKKNYPLISDAPDGEDIVIYKFLHRIEKGFYVDIGAAHLNKNSVTKFFYDRGWNGINIDARQSIMQLYKKHREFDINICAAVSDKRSECPFWEAEGLSTFEFSNVVRIGEGKFKKKFLTTTTLNSILQEHTIPDVHFLKIDVEGHEKNVLQGLDLKKYRPWLMIVESTLPNTMNFCHQEWENIVFDNDYIYITSFSVNRYYVAKEKKIELLDNFLQKSLTPYMMRKHINLLNRLIR